MADNMALPADVGTATGCGAHCHDCGRQYGAEHGFPDLVVPHEIWTKISPTGDEGGMLCPSCMVARAHAAGLEGVPATFRSGPFAIDGPAPDNVTLLTAAPDGALFHPPLIPTTP